MAVAKDDTIKVNIYHALAIDYPNYDPNKGLEAAKASLALAQKLDWGKGIVLSYIDIGLNQNSRTQYAAAKLSFDHALAKATEIGDKKLIGMAIKHIGITNYIQSNSPEALKCFFDALSLAEETHNRHENNEILEWIGRVYESQKNYESALLYYTKSYDSAITAGGNNAKAKNMLNIGQIYQLTGKNEEAIKIFEKSLIAFKQLGDESGIAVATAYMGAVYAQLHKYGEALQKDKEAINFYYAYSDRMNIAAILENMGKIYLSLSAAAPGEALPDSLKNRIENRNNAFIYLNKAIDICKDISYLEGLSVAYSDLSSAYEQTGDFKIALEKYKECITIRDSIYSSDNNFKIANLEINRAVDLKDKQLQIKKLQLEKNNSQSIFFISGIVVLLLVTLILFRNFSTQKKLNETISKLVNEQEKTIEQRTDALTQSHKKLINLIQFNVHNLREPITRIMGLLMLRKDVEKDDFFDNCLPLMEKSVKDLDDTLKEVIITSEQTKTSSV